jgi:hypothetical protein
MPKIWDEDGEEVSDWKTVDTAKSRIDRASDAKRGSRGFDANLETMVGLCSRCQNYIFIEDDMHQIIFSACKGVNWDNPIPMVKRKPIKNCSEFSKKGQMNLQNMFNIATLIDPPPEAKIKGFVPQGFTKKEKK